MVNFSCVDANADERAKVDLLTNGVGFTSRWEANVFKFVNQPNVFLHCRVRICFSTDGEQCDAFNCETSRKRRAAGESTGETDQVILLTYCPCEAYVHMTKLS